MKEILTSCWQIQLLISLNWQPGDKVIIFPPKTVDALAERMNSGLVVVDFYLGEKAL